MTPILDETGATAWLDGTPTDGQPVTVRLESGEPVRLAPDLVQRRPDGSYVARVSFADVAAGATQAVNPTGETLLEIEERIKVGRVRKEVDRGRLVGATDGGTGASSSMADGRHALNDLSAEEASLQAALAWSFADAKSLGIASSQVHIDAWEEEKLQFAIAESTAAQEALPSPPDNDDTTSANSAVGSRLLQSRLVRGAGTLFSPTLAMLGLVRFASTGHRACALQRRQVP